MEVPAAATLRRRYGVRGALLAAWRARVEVWGLLFGSLLVAGAALRLWQFGAAASQAVDELALSRNVVDLSWAALAGGPLEFAQVAPRGYLLLAKAAVAVAGPGDLALRSVALAASLLSLALFHLLSRRLLAEPAAVALSLAIFALRPELIHHAAEVKPYACDLAAVLALTCLCWDALSRGLTVRRGLLLGAAGAVAVCFSLGAVLALAGLAPALAVAAWAASPSPIPVTAPPLAARSRFAAAFLPWAAAAAPWAAACVAVTAWTRASASPHFRAYLQQFWAAAFAPWHAGAAAHARWLARSLAAELPGVRLGGPWPALCGGLAALGAVSLWRRHGARSLLLWGPLAASLAAAEGHLYPLAPRVSLFLVPSLVLAVAAGGAALAAGSAALAVAGGRVAAVSALAVPAFAAVPAVVELAHDLPVYRVEETKPILREVAERRRPGDAIYVYYGAGAALRFYGPRFGLRPADYVLGRCQRGDTRGYLRQLDGFRGKPRVWVVFSHALPRLGEDAAILAYLDALGQRRLALRAGPRPAGAGLAASAYLYDLSGTRRLPADAAARFPVSPPGLPFDRRFACFGPHNSAAPWAP